MIRRLAARLGLLVGPGRASASAGPAVGDPLLARLIDDPAAGADQLRELVRAEQPLLPLVEVDRRVQAAFDAAAGLGPIGELLADHTVVEIMVNGPGPVWVERAGWLERSGVELDAYDIELLVERLLVPLGLRVDRVSPVVDARLADGSRVNVVVPPVAVDGPVVSIRRFAPSAVPLGAFGPPAMVDVLERLVNERATTLVVGPTSSGKTTLVNALATLIDPAERVVCIEDTAELRLAAPNLVRLEARPANSEGVGRVELRRLVLTALRMRPDRLVVGEVRGAEAFDLLLALTSGHRGGLTTCHAAGPEEGLTRLELLASLAGLDVPPAAIRRLVHAAVDAVVHVDRCGPDRLVRSIVSVPSGGAPEPMLVPRWSAAGAPRPRPIAIERRAG